MYLWGRGYHVLEEIVMTFALTVGPLEVGCSRNEPSKWPTQLQWNRCPALPFSS